MITQEIYEDLKFITNLVKADAEQANKIAHYHYMFISKARICTTCPSSLSNAFLALREWFNKNNANLLRTIEAGKVAKDKKKTDVKVVVEEDKVVIKQEKPIEVDKAVEVKTKRRGRKTKK